MTEPVTYKTKLSIEQCVNRIETHLQKAKVFSLRGYPAGTVVYRLKGKKFRLKAGLGEHMTNSFEPILYGEFEPAPDGTLIRGSFRMHTSTRVFMTLWFGFAIAFLGLVLWAILVAPAAGVESVDQVPYWAPLVPVVIMTIAYVMMRYGMSLGASRKTAVKEFLRTTLEGVEQPAAGAPEDSRRSFARERGLESAADADVADAATMEASQTGLKNKPTSR